MPFITTPSFASGTGGLDFGGFGDILKSGLALARDIFAPSATVQPLPGGFQQAGFFPTIARQLPRIAKQVLGFVGGVIGGELLEGIFRSGGASDLDENAAFTDPVPGRCRPKPHVKLNPCTGKGIWFVPRGRPLVFSGDLSAARRLDRVAKTLDKARPKRRHHHHPR